MLEIRLHGRGGQGAVVGGNILAAALFSKGLFVQAFPFFGVERRGAPVCAFVRADEKRINIRHQIYTPDHLIILDETLINNPETFDGLKPEGFVVINTKHPPERFRKNPRFKRNKIAAVDANKIAIKHKLGTAMSPIVNTTIIGAFSQATKLCSIDAVCQAIKKMVPAKPEENAQAAMESYKEVKWVE